MQIDRRITNGLAWAGVFLVVGVPTADLLSAQFMGDNRAPQVAAVTPVASAPTPVSPTPAPASQRPAAIEAVTAVAAVEPQAPSAAGGTAVDAFMQSGKPLPSYITDAGASAAAPKPVAAKPVTTPAAAEPVPTQQAATPPVRQPVLTEPAIDPVEVASIPRQTKVAPIPMPLSMRPTAPVPTVASTEPVLIVPDRVVAPLPPADVTSSDLEDWESGPLSEFLAQREQGGNAADSSYDDDGFFFDEGPNAQRPRRDRYIGPVQDETYFFPFGN